MQPILSGSTTQRLVRTSIVSAMALVAAAYCFYDGYVGYPRENLKRAIKTLTPPPETLPSILPEINSESAAEIADGATLTDLKARWGEPGWRLENEVRYFGPGGQIVLWVRDDWVTKSEYQKARYKTELDLLVQKIMGIVIGAAGLALLIHWFRVILTRTTLTDEGLKTTGYPFVPFDAMKALHSDHYARKGWVDIEYALDGRTRRIRLDDYKVKAFPEIMEEICRRKGFEDPYRKWIVEKAAKPAS